MELDEQTQRAFAKGKAIDAALHKIRLTVNHQSLHSHHMTVKQAAKLLGASEWTVRHMCLDGRIPAVRRRKQWHIPKDFQKLMQDKLLASFKGVPNDF